MGYNLIVYDKLHYDDVSEACTRGHGYYGTYEEAEKAAKELLNEFLKLNWSKGMRPDVLIEQYFLYGEDPVILPAENPANKTFSARDYVTEIAESICKKLEDE